MSFFNTFQVNLLLIDTKKEGTIANEVKVKNNSFKLILKINRFFTIFYNMSFIKIYLSS